MLSFSFNLKLVNYTNTKINYNCDSVNTSRNNNSDIVTLKSMKKKITKKYFDNQYVYNFQKFIMHYSIHVIHFQQQSKRTIQF